MDSKERLLYLGKTYIKEIIDEGLDLKVYGVTQYKEDETNKGIEKIILVQGKY